MTRVRPLQDGVNKLAAYVRRLQRCCERVEDELSSRRLRVSDVELVYSSGFLSIVTRWEAFLEDALYEAVCGSVPSSLAKRRSISISSRAQLEKILLYPDREYISLTTVRQAQGLYDLFLRDAGPFGAVSESNRTYVQQAIWIRNAIAHSSESAKRVFQGKVPGVHALPTSRRTPGAFLRHEFRQAPNQRRLELYCAAILRAAEEMGDGWSAAVR